MLKKVKTFLAFQETAPILLALSHFLKEFDWFQLGCSSEVALRQPLSHCKCSLIRTLVLKPNTAPDTIIQIKIWVSSLCWMKSAFNFQWNLHSTPQCNVHSKAAHKSGLKFIDMQNQNECRIKTIAWNLHSTVAWNLHSTVAWNLHSTVAWNLHL